MTYRISQMIYCRKDENQADNRHMYTYGAVISERGRIQKHLLLLDLSVLQKVAYENYCDVVVSCSWLTLSSLVVSCDVVVSCSWLALSSLVILSYTVEGFDARLAELTVLRLLVVVVHLVLILIVAVEMVVAAAAVPV